MTKVVNIFGEPHTVEQATPDYVLKEAAERNYEHVIVIGVNHNRTTGLITDYDDVEVAHFYVARALKILLDLDPQ